MVRSLVWRLMFRPTGPWPPYCPTKSGKLQPDNKVWFASWISHLFFERRNDQGRECGASLDGATRLGLGFSVS